MKYQEILNQGSKTDHVETTIGGISALWILELYEKTDLINLLKNYQMVKKL